MECARLWRACASTDDRTRSDLRVGGVSIASRVRDSNCSTCGDAYDGEGMKRFAQDEAFDAVVAKALRGAKAEDVDAAEDARALGVLFDIFGYGGVQVFRTASAQARKVKTEATETPNVETAARNGDIGASDAERVEMIHDERVTVEVVPPAMLHVTLRPHWDAQSRELEFPFCSIPRDASCGVLRRVVEYELGQDVVIYDSQRNARKDEDLLCDMFAPELESVKPMNAWFKRAVDG